MATLEPGIRKSSLKKILLMAVIGFGAWGYYQNEVVSRSSIEPKQQQQVTNSKQMGQPTTAQMAPRFRCDGRQYCSQMHSRAEAEFFVRNCPNTKMDGDRDGIPCENDSRF